MDFKKLIVGFKKSSQELSYQTKKLDILDISHPPFFYATIARSMPALCTDVIT